MNSLELLCFCFQSFVFYLKADWSTFAAKALHFSVFLEMQKHCLLLLMCNKLKPYEQLLWLFVLPSLRRSCDWFCMKLAEVKLGCCCVITSSSCSHENIRKWNGSKSPPRSRDSVHVWCGGIFHLCRCLQSFPWWKTTRSKPRRWCSWCLKVLLFFSNMEDYLYIVTVGYFIFSPAPA